MRRPAGRDKARRLRVAWTRMDAAWWRRFLAADDDPRLSRVASLRATRGIARRLRRIRRAAERAGVWS